MRQVPLALAAVLLLTTPAPALDECPHEDTLGFLQGTYYVVGRTPEGEAYTGTAAIGRQGCIVTIRRCVEGDAQKTVAVVTTATADEVPVVRYSFERGGASVRGSYLIDGDLDNYPLLSGPQVVGTDTDRRGWEHLFTDRKRPAVCADN